MSNPMSYYNGDSANKPVFSKNKNSDVVSQSKKLNEYIQTITGYTRLAKKLHEWRKRHLMFNLRKKAGIDITSYLPRIVVYNGPGNRQDMAKKANGFLRHAGIVNTDVLYDYDVNDFICYYAVDAEDKITKAFEECERNTMNLTGLDELICNPRPARADFHDWVSVIMTAIIREMKKSDKHHPIFIEISQQNWVALCDRFSDLKSFSAEFIKSQYLKPEEMANILFNNICDKGFIFRKNLKGNLTSLFRKTLKQDGVRELSENQIRHQVFNSIINKQASRLQTSTESLTELRIKTIIDEDIPKNVFLADGSAVFY